jgi:hypothetical protein
VIDEPAFQARRTSEERDVQGMSSSNDGDIVLPEYV